MNATETQVVDFDRFDLNEKFAVVDSTLILDTGWAVEHIMVTKKGETLIYMTP